MSTVFLLVFSFLTFLCSSLQNCTGSGSCTGKSFVNVDMYCHGGIRPNASCEDVVLTYNDSQTHTINCIGQDACYAMIIYSSPTTFLNINVPGKCK